MPTIPSPPMACFAAVKAYALPSAKRNNTFKTIIVE